LPSVRRTKRRCSTVEFVPLTAMRVLVVIVASGRDQKVISWRSRSAPTICVRPPPYLNEQFSGLPLCGRAETVWSASTWSNLYATRCGRRCSQPVDVLRSAGRSTDVNGRRLFAARRCDGADGTNAAGAAADD
jgi:hypothetical protein